MSATLTRELTPEEIEQVYQDFREYIHSLSFGYVTNDPDLKASGADLVMLKTFYSPQEALYVMDMPRDDFFTVEWFAEKEEMSYEQAEEWLIGMCKRGNVYRERQGEAMMYHNTPAAHGIFEFHAGKHMSADWLGPMFATLGTGTLQICYDAGVPFYRAVPAGPEVVKPGELLPEDDIFAKLKTHRRFCIGPCACLDAVRDNLGQHNCDHPTGVCIQTDEMADFYIDDVECGRDATLEEVEALLKKGLDNDLCIQTTYARDNEIICQCNICHCGILPALKNWPGDAAQKVTNYYIDHNRETCVQCGICVESCPMKVISFDDEGFPSITGEAGPCIGCGVCVRKCAVDARILTRKADAVTDYPKTVWDTYPIMEENRRAKGALA